MNKLRDGIAGYGIVGKRRKKCIDQHPDMELIAVCDRIFSSDAINGEGINYYQSI